MANIDNQFAVAIDAGSSELFTTPKISTATIVFVIQKVVCLTTVLENAQLNVRTQKGKQYRPFSNSVTVIFDKTKAMKVFKNGKLHITGCTSVGYAESLVHRFLKSMDWNDTPIHSTKILTLNTILRMQTQQKISLEKMFEYLTNDATCQVRYTPDIYQGLIIKKQLTGEDRKISFLFFYTGSVIICGVRKPEELSFGLSYVNSLMKDILSYIVI